MLSVCSGRLLRIMAIGGSGLVKDTGDSGRRGLCPERMEAQEDGHRPAQRGQRSARAFLARVL